MLLFSGAGGLPEDERTVRYLQLVAHEAGFYTDFCYLHEAGFTREDGVFNADVQLADCWFKLYPWENIAEEELELTRLLERMRAQGRTRILNPAYTLLFQSKGLMALMYEMFLDSPYLLPTAFQPLAGVFFAWEACGLGFRRGGAVIDDMAKFVGHIVT
jgi:glutathionylspermidine synthase